MELKTKESFKPNIKQQEAIDTLKGPVMLLAGPGTGKTFTLIKRIEKLLEEGVFPESILCLTFSDAASCEMKTRLTEKIGIKASGVNISTYHSFCMDIIRQNSEDFEIAENVQKVDSVTKQAIIKEAIDEFDEIKFLKDKWGNKYFYISQLATAFEIIKRERVDEEDYYNILQNGEEWQLKLDELYLKKKEDEEKKGKTTKSCLEEIEKQLTRIGKAKEVYSLFKIYERKMSENNLIDYSDMINLVLEKMENDSGFLSDIAKDYKFVLVDEYQDTSKVQNELIFNILKGANTDNIFVVGDDDQIIYSFQGARSGNLNDFLNNFKNTKVICLEENRRSTQTILDFAESLIEIDKFRLTNNKNYDIQKKLIAKNESVIKKEEKIKFNIYQETIQENNNIVEQIENLIKSGTKPSEIAILAKKHDQLENFARLFKQKNIPYALQRKQNAFDFPSFIQTYFYLKILSKPYIEQDKLFGLLSFKPFKIKDETMVKLFISLRKGNKNWFEIIESMEEEDIKGFYETYSKLKTKKAYTPLMPFIYEVITETGILKFYSNSETSRFENIQAIQSLINEAKSYAILHKGAMLDDFIIHLDTYFKENIRVELKDLSDKANAIQLTTYHGSKGREFEHVFMPDLTSRMFEKARGGNNIKLPIIESKFSEDKELNKDAELLRLLFVGITRAKFGLHLSHSNAREGSSETSSKYISNLFPKNSHLVEQHFYELNTEDRLNEIIKDIKLDFKDSTYKDELKQRVENLVISATSLNKYLNCPLQYFYSEILKVPVFIEDTDILSYGSSIHHAIDFMTKDAIKNKSWGNIETMLEKFLERMNSAEFASKDKKEELIERGKNSIEKNYPKLIESSPNHILSTEYEIDTKFMNHTLKGFIDRITTDNEGNIHISDFKTGSYKKVNSNENYYNQLRFYKFIYEQVNPDKKVKSTSLVFFEDGCKSSCAEPDLTNNEEIKDVIKETLANINNLHFEAKKSDNVCKFCNYKLICKLNS